MIPRLNTRSVEVGAHRIGWVLQTIKHCRDRMHAACATNKSVAIAHVMALGEDVHAEAQGRKGRKKS